VSLPSCSFTGVRISHSALEAAGWSNTLRSSRRYSPSDQAWNGQPRGVNGASASAISAMCDRPGTPKCHSVNGFRNRLRARARVFAQSPCARTHASTKGPKSHGQTVPWGRPHEQAAGDTRSVTERHIFRIHGCNPVFLS
jgi:hypothetical protein